jgi:hypothetical protein
MPLSAFPRTLTKATPSSHLVLRSILNDARPVGRACSVVHEPMLSSIAPVLRPHVGQAMVPRSVRRTDPSTGRPLRRVASTRHADGEERTSTRNHGCEPLLLFRLIVESRSSRTLSDSASVVRCRVASPRLVAPQKRAVQRRRRRRCWAVDRTRAGACRLTPAWTEAGTQERGLVGLLAGLGLGRRTRQELVGRRRQRQQLRLTRRRRERTRPDALTESYEEGNGGRDLHDTARDERSAGAW